jgi:hypothetical protein
MPLPFFISIKGIVQELIHKLKYKGHEDIGAFRKLVRSRLKRNDYLTNCKYADSVPLHKKI